MQQHCDSTAPLPLLTLGHDFFGELGVLHDQATSVVPHVRKRSAYPLMTSTLAVLGRTELAELCRAEPVRQPTERGF